MKIYYVGVTAILILAYAVLHFGFRTGGDAQLYRINDNIAFELHEPNENSNGIAIRSYRPTNVFVKFICGACQLDPAGGVDMVNVNYRNGDHVYTDFPQHDKAPTDIVNLTTGETVNATVPSDFTFKDDLNKITEYRSRGLVAGDQFRLDQVYVKANFTHLSTFTDRCIYARVFFGIVALFLLFPKLILWVIDAFIKSADPHDPANYLNRNS